MAREGLLPAWASRVRSRYRTPHVTTPLVAAAACLYVMLGLPRHAWERFGISLAIGLII